MRFICAKTFLTFIYLRLFRPCLSREYNFQQVQQYFKDNCIENVSSTPSMFHLSRKKMLSENCTVNHLLYTGSETSSGMTSISSSNAITSSDQSTGHGFF